VDLHLHKASTNLICMGQSHMERTEYITESGAYNPPSTHGPAEATQSKHADLAKRQSNVPKPHRCMPNLKFGQDAMESIECSMEL